MEIFLRMHLRRLRTWNSGPRSLSTWTRPMQSNSSDRTNRPSRGCTRKSRRPIKCKCSCSSCCNVAPILYSSAINNSHLPRPLTTRSRSMSCLATMPIRRVRAVITREMPRLHRQEEEPLRMWANTRWIGSSNKMRSIIIRRIQSQSSNFDFLYLN